MNPFVFIVGCPRSGTTLLQRILDAHPQIAITPETHWIPSYFRKAKKKTPEGWVTAKLVAKLQNYHRFSQLGIGRMELEKLLGSGGSVSYPRFVSGIFDLYGEARGKAVVGDKTPGYARNISLLHGLWPKAKFVHLIRDGRDVCLSAIQWRKPGKLLVRSPTWREDPVTTAAFWWEWHVRLGREHGRMLGSDLYFEVRYESLVSQPADECVKLCDFLGMPFDSAMLRFHEGRVQAGPGLDSKDAWLPVTPGLRNWRSQMPAQQLERFEAAAGDLLEELGYPRALLGRQLERQSYASRMRDSFARGAQAVGDWLT